MKSAGCISERLLSFNSMMHRPCKFSYGIVFNQESLFWRQSVEQVLRHDWYFVILDVSTMGNGQGQSCAQN